MAIAPKPKSKPIDEKSVEEIINKGGSTPSEKEKKPGKEKQPVIVHIPGEWLAEIDELLKRKRVKTSRHTWLLEAIVEKLDKEKG